MHKDALRALGYLVVMQKQVSRHAATVAGALSTTVAMQHGTAIYVCYCTGARLDSSMHKSSRLFANINP